jgi:hypothetical protein
LTANLFGLGNRVKLAFPSILTIAGWSRRTKARSDHLRENSNADENSAEQGKRILGTQCGGLPQGMERQQFLGNSGPQWQRNDDGPSYVGLAPSVSKEEETVDFLLEPYDEDEDVPSYEDDDMDEEGCIFPEHCVMPGYHLKSECATADMMRQMIEDGES